MIPIGGVTVIDLPDGRTSPGENAILGLPGGGYVAVWSTFFFGAGGSGAFLSMRVFDASGNPTTAEVQIANGRATSPSLALTSTGFALAFGLGGASNPSPFPSDISVQFFDNDGTAIGGKVSVNTTTAGEQDKPSITTLTNGNLVVAWHDPGSPVAGDPDDIRLQVIGGTGTKIGAEILVNATEAGSQDAPTVQALAGGGFVVTWQDSSASGGTTDYLIRGQIFDAVGARVGAEFTVNSATAGIQTDADVAALPNGGFVVTWTTDDAAPGTNADIKAQLFDVSGNKVGGEIIVAANAGNEIQPEVAVDSLGRFVITWADFSGGTGAIKTRAYDSAGSPIGAVHTVAPADPSGFVYPAITALADDTFEILFETNLATIPRGPERRVEHLTLDDSYSRALIFGTSLPDLIVGDDTDNVIQAFGGGSIFGHQGDEINGGGGSDTVVYSDATASVQVDLVLGQGSGNVADHDSYVNVENVVGSAFNDVLIGNDVANRLDGAGGDDVIRTGKGADVVIGGAGTDSVRYEDSDGTIFVNLTLGLGFNNYAAGDSYSGIENVVGSLYADYLIGDDGANMLDGNSGDDVLIGAKGADILIGGAGSDAASYEDSSGAVFVSLALGNGFNNSAEGDTYTGIENVIGSRFNDFVIGNSGVNKLDGRDGDDTLIGGLGADILIGGPGSDSASYEDNQGDVFVNLLTGQGFSNAAQGDTYSSIENLTGGAYRDVFIGDNGLNILNGGEGNDYLIGGLSGDSLIGGGGADTASYEDNWGAVFVNLASGQGFGNAAQGDTYSSIENVIGGAYADYFIGDGSANLLDGKSGADTLTGGGGADSFAFTTALGAGNVDSITDFVAGTDKVILDNAIFFGLSEGALGPNVFINGTAATGGQNRIVYDQSTGQLWFDDDGFGTDPAILFAVLDNKPVLTSADFLVI
jgi:Ca2+-binding RTX toxin-like protein